MTVGGAPHLVRLSLTAGATLVGPIGDGTVGIRGLALFTPPPASTVFAVTATNNLLSFSSALPSIIQSTTPITGLQSGETIHGIDTRPATGQLYALGSTGRLYTLNPATGAATQVGTGTFAVPLSGASFGFDFDPVADRIRVVSDAGQNMRLNPDTGAVIDSDPNIAGTQPDMYLSSTYVVGLAYSDNAAGTTTTTLYGIDGANDWLVRQGGPNGNPSPNQGQITSIGSLGVDLDWSPVVPTASFEITEGGVPLAVLQVGGKTSLYTIDLATGKATAVGPVGTGTVRIVGLAAAPPERPSVLSITAASPTAGGERRVLPGHGHPDRGHGRHGDGRLRHGRRHRGRRPGLRGHQRHSRLPARRDEQDHQHPDPRGQPDREPRDADRGAGQPRRAPPWPAPSHAQLTITDVPPGTPSVLSISAASPTAGGERWLLPGHGHPDRGHGGHGDGRLRHGRRHRDRRPGLRGHQWHARLPARRDEQDHQHPDPQGQPDREP